MSIGLMRLKAEVRNLHQVLKQILAERIEDAQMCEALLLKYLTYDIPIGEGQIVRINVDAHKARAHKVDAHRGTSSEQN
ncbi:hypothetical protein ACTXT7_007071 [Hymenolepis weldensis]